MARCLCSAPFLVFPVYKKGADWYNEKNIDYRRHLCILPDYKK